MFIKIAINKNKMLEAIIKASELLDEARSILIHADAEAEVFEAQEEKENHQL